MTNKTTKSALLMSALALLLCIAMLMGTTYAWFTDEVKSGVNQIIAGNLDVDVYDGEGNSISNVETLFDDVELWEPGAVAYENLTVANLGTLALKYRMSVNFTNENTVNGYGLSQALKVAVVPDGFNGTREEAMALNGTSLADFVLPGVLMEEGDTDVYGIVIWWEPSADDNNWNVQNGKTTSDGQPLHIDLGIKLVATQISYEEDSFDKYYDGATPWYGSVYTGWYNTTDTEFVIGTAEELAGLAKLVNEGNSFAGKTIKLASNIDLNNLEWTPIGDWNNAFEGTFDGQGYTIYNLAINAPAGEGVGLFGVVANATIKNVNLCNVDIDAYSMVAALVGAAYPANISGCNISGDVNIVAEYAYVAGIAGYCYYGTQVDACTLVADDDSMIKSVTRNAVGGITAWLLDGNHKVTNCSVKNIDLVGWTNVGGITGFVHYNNTISGCTVEDVNLVKTRADGNPGIGLIAGGYSYSAANAITLSGNSAKNVTLSGTHIDYSTYNNLYGSEYGGATEANFVLVNNDVTSITNNLVEVVVASNVVELKNALAAGGYVVLGADITATDVVTLAEISGVSATLNLNGHKINATLNGADGWSQIFRVSNGATFTVTGEGSVHAKAYPTQAYGSVIFNNVGGDLIINGGTYTMDYGTYAEGYLLPAIVDTNSNTMKATTIINGGEFRHSRNMFRNFAQPNRGANNATLIINGGTFVGKADDFATIWNQKTNSTGVEGDGIVTINGGNFQYMDICNDFATGVTIADGLNIAVQS